MKSNNPIAFMLWFVVLCLLSLFFDTTDAIAGTKPPSRTCIILKGYFKKHLIHSSNSSLCYNNTRIKRQHLRQGFMHDFPLATQAEIIQSLRNSENVTAIEDLPTPFTEVLVKNVNHNNKNFAIPLVLKAKIRYANKPTVERPSIPQFVRDHLKTMMGAIPQSKEKMKMDLPYDDAGHLLAYSLGGGMNNIWNYAPQINRLNRNTREGGTSSWQEEEGNMRKFLETNRQGFIDWTMLVIYGDGDTLKYEDNIKRPFRPIGFCMHYSATYYNRGTHHIDRDEMCFSNDPGADCLSDDRYACNALPVGY